jgi:mRNA-degrading endonuclease toxin of MazEF toxin-antitoxin module
MRIYCAECEGKAIIRSSEQMSKTTRRVYCACPNIKCGHTFAVDVSFSHTISPSALALPPSVRKALQTQSLSQIRGIFKSLG